MCQTNAYGDAKCDHEHDRLDRSICNTIMYHHLEYGSRWGLPLSGIMEVLEWKFITDASDPEQVKLVGRRLQVLKQQGFLTTFGWAKSSGWKPTQLLKRKFGEYVQGLERAAPASKKVCAI